MESIKLRPPMDKLDKTLLKHIGKTLDIAFYEWQINYILDIPMILDMRLTGRQSGKTLAYIVKLLFSDDSPIMLDHLDQIVYISDWWSCEGGMDPNGRYTRWFGNKLWDVYVCLKEKNIMTRPVIKNKEPYTKKEVEEAYSYNSLDGWHKPRGECKMSTLRDSSANVIELLNKGIDRVEKELTNLNQDRKILELEIVGVTTKITDLQFRLGDYKQHLDSCLTALQPMNLKILKTKRRM